MSNVFVSLEDDGSQWVMLEDYLALQNKFREFTNYVYEIVSVNCTDVGEAHAGLQEEIIAIRKSGLTTRAPDVAKAEACECETPDFAPFIECQNCGKPPRR